MLSLVAHFKSIIVGISLFFAFIRFIRAWLGYLYLFVPSGYIGRSEVIVRLYLLLIYLFCIFIVIAIFEVLFHIYVTLFPSLVHIFIFCYTFIVI